MRASRILPLLLSVVAMASPAAAQVESTTQPRMPAKHMAWPPEHMACPVDLRADRRGDAVTREVNGKSIPTGAGLVLHFRASNATAPRKQVIAADITVYGYSAKAMERLLPIQSRPATDLKEDFHLAGSASAPLIEKSVWTAKINGIASIELTRVEFSDGSTWERTIPKECVVEPNPFMLVK